MSYIDKFHSETQLIEQYGINKAFIVWSMGLYLDEQDLEDLAYNNLTDNPEDHGIDFLRYDEDDSILYIAQGYYTNKKLQCAPSGKAADLNTACAWLVNGEIKNFHPDIQDVICSAREAILSDNLSKIKLVYLHNCGESVTVKRELDTAQRNLKALTKEHDIEIDAVELGNESLEHLYQNLVANIIATDNVECPFPVKYWEQTSEWKAAVLTVSGQWIRELYNQYSGDLFSANYRGFLGSYRTRINSGIKQTAERSPQNFWAFNNGITLLTTHVEEKDGKTALSGVSIINGAQTTGALGSIPMSINLEGTQILTRIIECSNVETIGNIVKYNNTQNKITAWDSFSNDPIQIQLQEEFHELGHVYNIKRGFSNREGFLSIDAAIQPLLALSGKYKDANRSKTYLFESRTLYTEAFEHRGGRNVLFACCLNTCLQEIKTENKVKIVNGSASDLEKRIYNILSIIKSKFYLLAILTATLHRLIVTLTEAKRISIMPQQADAKKCDYITLVTQIKPIVSFLLPLVCNSLGDDFHAKYNDSKTVDSIAKQVEANVTSLKAVTPDVQKILTDIGKILCNG